MICLLNRFRFDFVGTWVRFINHTSDDKKVNCNASYAWLRLEDEKYMEVILIWLIKAVRKGDQLYMNYGVHGDELPKKKKDESPDRKRQKTRE